MFLKFKLLDHILGPIGVNEGIRTVHDDNFIDRLSHYYTVIILLFFNVTVVTVEYVGDPIHCFCPTEFTENEVEYTKYVCWVSNTYYIPFSRPIPAQYEMRRTDEITYYQWVPMIMLMMGLLFKLPRYLWKYLAYTSSGVGLKKLVETAKNTQIDSPEDREKKLKAVAKFIDVWLQKSTHHRAGPMTGLREGAASRCNLGFGRHYGNYLVCLCIAVKFLYFLNAIGQLYFLNEFLGGDKFYIYGYEVLASILSENDWSKTKRFPRVTMCDFDLRQLSNVQKWTVQCVLPINLFNEKFFIFLWFWITVLAAMSLMNLLYTILVALFPQPRKNFAKKYLKINFLYDSSDKDPFLQKLTNRFISEYLQQDGIFLLKIISANSNTVMVTDIVRYLWDIYRRRQFHTETNGILHTVHGLGQPNTDHVVAPRGRVVNFPNENRRLESYV